MKFKTVLLTALTACLIPTLAQAEFNPDESKELRPERLGHPEHHKYFAQADANGDEQISFEEFKSSHQKRAAKHFGKIDKNGDEQISLEEFQDAKLKKASRHFDKIDANGDRELSKDEIEAFHKQLREGKGSGSCPHYEKDM